MRRSFQSFLFLFAAFIAFPVFAQNTVLVMDSDPGDYIGGGANYYYTRRTGLSEPAKTMTMELASASLTAVIIGTLISPHPTWRS